MTIERVEQLGSTMAIWARTRARSAACPGCGNVSDHVHSRYQRRLAESAICGRPAEVRLTVRRFFCRNSDCTTKTFTEQVPGLTTPFARRTPCLTGQLVRIGLALAGRAGARLAAALGMWTSRSSLLRLVRDQPTPTPGTVAVLGVDDFALRRGHVYGTVLLDMDSHRPIDLLPDREAESFAGWLRAHDGVQVICRDRAGAYAQAGQDAAPLAVQVADRWHVWHNLAGYVDKAVAKHLSCVRAPSATQPPEATSDTSGAGTLDDDAAPSVDQVAAAAAARRRDGALVRRTRERHAAVHALLSDGKSLKQIGRELGLARGTVRRFARAGTVDDVLAVPLTGRPTVLEPHLDYLHQRWANGLTSATALTAELRELGYRGSYGTVRDYVADLRDPHTARARTRPTATPVTARTVAGWILKNPQTLEPEDVQHLAQARARCPHLDRLTGHVTEFAKILTGRHGDRLDDWLAAVEADDEQPELHSFANGIRRDYDAVRAGLTLEHNSGAVEGAVNRIKMLKRQMYGRANFDLLRQRVLLAA